MTNELLTAISKDKETSLDENFTLFIDTSSHKHIKEQILEALQLQREKCAEEVETVNTSRNPYEPFYEVDKESITNAKIV